MGDGVRLVSGPSLADIERQLKGITDGRVQRKMTGALAREVRADIKRAFDTETAPSGVRWKPLRHPRPGRILHKSGETRRTATRILLFGKSIRVQLSPWGGFHQSGTSRIPARPFIPTDPLPPATLARYTRAMLEAAALNR